MDAPFTIVNTPLRTNQSQNLTDSSNIQIPQLPEDLIVELFKYMSLMHAPKLALVNGSHREIFSKKLVRMAACKELFKAALDHLENNLSDVLHFRNLRKLMQLDPERNKFYCLKKIMSGYSEAFDVSASKNRTFDIFCQFVEYSKKNIQWLNPLLEEIETLKDKRSQEDNTLPILKSLIVGYLHLGQQRNLKRLKPQIIDSGLDILPKFLSVEVFFQSLIEIQIGRMSLLTVYNLSFSQTSSIMSLYND